MQSFFLLGLCLLSLVVGLQSSPPPLESLLALLAGVALEWQAAPLALGTFSPALAWAVALTGLSSLPLAWIWVCLFCAISARNVLRGYNLRDALLDFIPAALAAAAADRLDLASALVVLTLLALPVPWMLSHWLGRATQSAKSRLSLKGEHYALMCLGLAGQQLAQIHPLWLALLVPPLLSLLAQAQSGAELQQRRARHYALTRAQGEVAQEQARQEELRRLLDFRAEAFAWLEKLASKPLTEAEVLEQALSLVRSLTGIECQMVDEATGPSWKTPDQAAWPIPGKGMVRLRSPRPWSSETLPTLGVYFHYLGITLERVRYQSEILGAVQRLHDLLNGAHELSTQVESQAILEVAVARASHWVKRPVGARWENLQVGQPGDLWLGGLSLSGQGLAAADLEALRLWSWLVGAALQRCQIQQGLLHNSKLATIGQLAAGVAHELNTPLGSVTVALGLVKLNLKSQPEKALARLDTANKSLQQMSHIISKLLQFASRSQSTRESIDLADIGRDAVAMVESSFQIAQIQLDSHFESIVREVNAGEIQQVLVNLLVNARLALSHQAEPRVQIRLSAAGEFVVEDNGPGVPEEIQQRIFEPFFSTREVGQGVGLGLSLSRELASDHGANLEYFRSSLGGAGFRLALP